MKGAVKFCPIVVLFLAFSVEAREYIASNAEIVEVLNTDSNPRHLLLKSPEENKSPVRISILPFQRQRRLIIMTVEAKFIIAPTRLR